MPTVWSPSSLLTRWPYCVIQDTKRIENVKYSSFASQRWLRSRCTHITHGYLLTGTLWSKLLRQLRHKRKWLGPCVRGNRDNWNGTVMYLNRYVSGEIKKWVYNRSNYAWWRRCTPLMMDKVSQCRVSTTAVSSSHFSASQPERSKCLFTTRNEDSGRHGDSVSRLLQRLDGTRGRVHVCKMEARRTITEDSTEGAEEEGQQRWRGTCWEW